MSKNFGDKLINNSDMKAIKDLAKKYNMSVSDLGRYIVRQAESNLTRQIRVTDEEYDFIKQKAKEHGVTMTRWCSLACSDFLKSNTEEVFFSDFSPVDTRREKRIAAAIRNQKEESELLKIAAKYSIKISTLIRYCALNYSGKENE